MTYTGLPPAVLVATSNAGHSDAIQSALEKSAYRVKCVGSIQEALDVFYTSALHAVVLQYRLGIQDGPDVFKIFKGSNIFGFTPLILLFDSPADAEAVNWEHVPADDYVTWPLPDGELASRMRLCGARAHRDVNANPLTGLPGNLPILHEAEKRLRANTPFALGHFDINNFKAFNDKYGFHRGDEVLRMTARLLENTFHDLKHPDAYVGHLGGDDFIFMLPCDEAEPACRRICAEFDSISINFYDDEDRHNGFIHSHDRQGKPCNFPLMSCSIGVIDTSTSSVEHIADLSTRAAQVKGFAKTMPGSHFIIDRRT
jgi:GGDEF domain-containing protein